MGEMIALQSLRTNKKYDFDVTDYKAYPVDPVNCFEKEELNYNKVDEIIEALILSDLELAIKIAACAE